jgi:hypothetical protein
MIHRAAVGGKPMLDTRRCAPDALFQRTENGTLRCLPEERGEFLEHFALLRREDVMAGAR